MFVLKKYMYLFLAGIIIIIDFPQVSYAQSTKKIRTIIVDAGHGGKDDGAHGEYEGSLHSKEKNITLAIALKLVDELKNQMPGVNIIATRTTDIYQNPREKAQIANANHGDIFICIHADAVNLKIGSRIIGYKMETYTSVKYTGKGKKRKKIITSHERQVAIKQYYKIPTDRKGTSSWIFSSQKTNDKMEAMKKSDLLFNADDNDTLNINEEDPEWKANALLYTQNYFKKSYKIASDIEGVHSKLSQTDNQ